MHPPQGKAGPDCHLRTWCGGCGAGDVGQVVLALFPVKQPSLPLGLPLLGTCPVSQLPVGLQAPWEGTGLSLQFAFRACPISVYREVPRQIRRVKRRSAQVPLDWHWHLAPSHPSTTQARWSGSSLALPLLDLGAPGAPSSQGYPQLPLLKAELRAAEAGVPAEGHPV